MDRLIKPKVGASGSTSQDYLELTAKLFHQSEKESRSSSSGNHSAFVLAGIPLLVAAVHSFATEYESFMSNGPLAEALCKALSNDPLASLLESRYRVSGDLLADVKDLIEIRNEICHPVPRPPGTPDNWPEYLRHVKNKGLLSSTGDPTADFIMFHQITSHRLFAWAVDVIKGVFSAIVNSNPGDNLVFQLFLTNFRIFDLPQPVQAP